MSQLSDPPCPQCCGAVPEETPPPNSGLYERGYICCVHETLATVAEHIFKESPGIKEDPGFRKQFVDALSRIYNDSHRRGKIRPCIMMAAVSPDEHRRAGPHMRTEGPIICIMGTFHGSTPRDRVYLHFLVPMFPNCGEMRGGGVPAHRRPRDHLHTRPKPWKHYKQWAIAFLYRSPNPILEAWRTGEPRTAGIDGKTTPEYWLDRESFSWFRAQCEERLDSWSALCKADPNFARSCAMLGHVAQSC